MKTSGIGPSVGAVSRPRRHHSSRSGERSYCLVAAVLALLVILPWAHAETVKVARLKYGGGGDWYSNPTSVPNLLTVVRQRTTIAIAPKPDIADIDSDDIFKYAMLFVTGHGRIRFTAPQAERLRRYLRSGGFVHVDDNYGLDESFRPEMRKMLPDMPLVELPFDHPIYHAFYDFPRGLPKVHEHHGGPPHGYGVIYEGRVVLFYSYNTDLQDGWESAEVHHDPPDIREAALKMGVNVVTYALSR